MIVGVSGACRREELTKLSTRDISDEGNFIKIRVEHTKTNIIREFTITDGNANFLTIFRKYSSLRNSTTDHDRFFVSYRNGKCTKQPVGVNTIGGIPKIIAEYLKLKNPEMYTGHCFRRSSATLLADSGASMSMLKRHGGWKSNVVAEGYVEDSIANKRIIANKILGNSTSTNTSSSTSTSNVCIPMNVDISDSNVVIDNSQCNVVVGNLSHEIPIDNNKIQLNSCVFNNCSINFGKN